MQAAWSIWWRCSRCQRCGGRKCVDAAKVRGEVWDNRKVLGGVDMHRIGRVEQQARGKVPGGGELWGRREDVEGSVEKRRMRGAATMPESRHTSIWSAGVEGEFDTRLSFGGQGLNVREVTMGTTCPSRQPALYAGI
eukprot:360516-Chlamydomonas_euryale.AAC.2